MLVTVDPGFPGPVHHETALWRLSHFHPKGLLGQLMRERSAPAASLRASMGQWHVGSVRA